MRQLLIMMLLLPMMVGAQIRPGEVKDVPNMGAKGNAAKSYKAVWVGDTGGVKGAMFTERMYQDALELAAKNPEDMPPYMPVDLPVLRNAINIGNYVNALEIGCKPDYHPGKSRATWTDNTGIFRHWYDSTKQYYPRGFKPKVYFPSGGEYGYHFYHSFAFDNGEGIELVGDPGLPYNYQSEMTTKFFFGTWENPVSGFVFGPKSLSSSVSDLWVIGEVTPTAQISGIYHENILYLKNVYAERFNWGFYANADIGRGSNASLSYYQSCRAAHNKTGPTNGGGGFYAGGPDANWISYNACIAVDNQGVGFQDASLLGNYYYGIQTEANTSYPIYVTSLTAQGVWVAPYTEGGQPPCYINPGNSQTNVVGGINPNGWTGQLPGGEWHPAGGCIQEGVRSNRQTINSLLTGAVTLDRGEDPQHNTLSSVTFQYRSPYNKPFKAGYYSGHTTFMEMLEPNAEGPIIGNPIGSQPIAKASVPFTTMTMPTDYWRNGKLYALGYPGSPKFDGTVFQVGYEIENQYWTPGAPEKWYCTVGGRQSAHKREVQVSNLNTDGGDQTKFRFTLDNPAEYEDLRIGDNIEFTRNKAVGQIWHINSLYTVEVNSPMKINRGDRVNFFGGMVEYMYPVSYTENTVTITFSPFNHYYKQGDTELINYIPTPVKSVRIDKGVQYVEFGVPPGGDPQWFWGSDGYNANIVLGENNSIRKPMYYNHSESALKAGRADWYSTITLAFPMPDLQPGAVIQLNHLPATVKAVNHLGVVVEQLEGRVFDNYGKSSFRIRQPQFIEKR